MLSKFMDQLAKDMEIEDTFETEVPGSFSIPLDEGVALLITSTGKGFILHSSFGEVPKGGEEEFYTQAMLANLLGKGTSGAVLGLDEEGKRLLLSKEVEYSIDYYEFRDMIEDFMNSIDFWTEEANSFVSREEV